MSTLWTKPVALWFELKAGINLCSSLVACSVSAGQGSFLHGNIKDSSFDQGFRYYFYYIQKKFGSTQNQHWVNREVVQCPFAQPILEPLLLLSARNHPSPRPGHLIRGVGQHSRINVEDNLSPCFQSLSAMAAESLPVELVRSNSSIHPIQAGAHLSRAQPMRLSRGAVHRRVLLCLAALPVPALASLQAYREP